MKAIGLCLTVSLLALAAPTASFAAMGACEGAVRNRSADDEIRLYTLCMRNLARSQMFGALHNRGVAHMRKGDFDEAIADLNASLAYNPHNGIAYFNRAAIHAREGDLDFAVEDLGHAVHSGSTRIHSAARLRRADLLQITGDYAGAIADYDEVIAVRLKFMDPDRRRKLAQRAEAQLGKAELLATASDPSVRDGAQAVALALEALTHSDSAYHRFVLAAAFAEAGQFEDAVREQLLAMQMMAQDGAPADPRFDAQLAAYQMGRAYRDTPANCAAEPAANCGLAWASNEPLGLRVKSSLRPTDVFIRMHEP